jgi:hypothetical protein
MAEPSPMSDTLQRREALVNTVNTVSDLGETPSHCSCCAQLSDLHVSGLKSHFAQGRSKIFVFVH